MTSSQTAQYLGKLITFEGIDGAGKTTHLNWLQQEIGKYLEDKFKNKQPHQNKFQALESHIISTKHPNNNDSAQAILTREPGGTLVGEALRQIILHQSVTKETQTLIMFAARQEHLNQIIVPALSRGDWVICDRFTDATFAYQGGGAGVPMSMLQTLEALVHANIQPDLTILFDLPPADALIRRQKRQADYFESQSNEYFERVRKVYLERAAMFLNRYVVIDASQTIENVQAQMQKTLADFLEKCEN